MTTKKIKKTEDCALKGQGGQRVDLVSVDASGTLDGMFLRMKIRQTYRNEGSENVETIYTFPLAWGTTLLGVSISINGKTMKGTVIEKKEAQERYEDAIIDGDTPVMLESAGRDLYSASLGNLLPGEEAIIELEYGQILSVQDGELRLSLPCTLAPRYGEASLIKDFVERHFVRSNPLIERRFHFELEVIGALAKSRISSPTHRISSNKNAECTRIALDRTSMLDRDMVLLLSGVEDAAYATCSADLDVFKDHVCLLSFTPDKTLFSKPKNHQSTPINLKVLVDCSGSMAGDSIVQARIALSSLIDTLNPTDKVSFSKFGGQTANILGELAACSPEHIAALRDETNRLEADMGGTEMNRAIQRVMAINEDSGERPETAAILLITDGEVWDIENVVATVRCGGHKIYAIGVGSSPAESLLREMALASDGQCSMVTPKEDMRPLVLRLCKSMRDQRFIQVKINFAEPTIWQSPTRLSIDPGSMVHVWTKISSAPSAAPRISWSETSDCDEPSANHEVAIQNIAAHKDSDLPRMLAAQQILNVVDETTVRDIALRYQLVTRYTNLFLVFQRSESEKPGNLPHLKPIEHMLAAGWQGNGSVLASSDYDVPAFFRRSVDVDPYVGMSTPSVFRTNRTFAHERASRSSVSIFKTLSIALMHTDRRDNPFKKFIEGINQAAATSNNFRSAMKQGSCDDAISLISNISDELKAHRLSQSNVLALLFLWLVNEKKFPVIPTRFALRLVRGELASVDKDLVRIAFERFEEETQKIPALVDIPTEDDFDNYEIPEFLK